MRLPLLSTQIIRSIRQLKSQPFSEILTPNKPSPLQLLFNEFFDGPLASFTLHSAFQKCAIGCPAFRLSGIKSAGIDQPRQFQPVRNLSTTTQIGRITAEWIRLQWIIQPHPGNPRTKRVQVNIVSNGTEIRCFPFDRQCFVAPLEEMSSAAKHRIEPLRIGALKPLHSGHQIGLRCFGSVKFSMKEPMAEKQGEMGPLTGPKEGF
ncbi:hypothetical protein PDESU_01607 [Pontiella desulfatans]|uniref:Uncharacterized protein n=1 Tax=Pontiella desulfatans TaxID=2750659 RepID=A0A6C2TZM2_PONDE|nr:hypothetical protein PDESU_01607 [Pontiella desulfatans]